MVSRRMITWRPWWSAFFATALLLVSPQPAPGQTYEGRELVKASLVAEVNAIVPGQPFTAGLLLRMVPKWHTYWKFPGDAGGVISCSNRTSS